MLPRIASRKLLCALEPRRVHTAPTTARVQPHRPTKTTVPVDDLCIPLSPPYSISSYIPDPTPLSREHLTKLHRLAALTPPSTEEGWDKLRELGGLIAIMDGVRLVDTSALGEVASKGEIDLVDSRVRERGVEMSSASAGEGEVKRIEEDEGYGTKLLEMAQVRDGNYYVVRTPVGIRGKKRKVAVGAEEPED